MKAILQANPGDKVFFAGRMFISRLIALRTCSLVQLLEGTWISHVGRVFRYHGELMLAESTTLNDWPCAITGRYTKGVQAHPLAARIQSYPGRVWYERLDADQRLDAGRETRLTNLVLEKLGKGYDTFGAGVAGTFRLKRFWHFDRSRLFCSEFDTWLDRQLDIQVVPPDVASGTITPAYDAIASVNSDMYQPLERVK